MNPTNKEKNIPTRNVIDFATTAWYDQEYSNLQEHLSNILTESIQSYPEKDNITLRTMLAKRNDLHPDNIIILGGRTGAFYHIAQAFAGSTTTIMTPSFRVYETATSLHGWKQKFLPNTLNTEEIKLDGSDFCWICSPNNPDGKYRSRTELLRLIESNPKVKFVLDQSYFAFTTAPIINLSDIKNYPNIIIVRSFTHSYGLSGMRVGYIVADKSIAKSISKFVIPWSTNTLAIEAVKYILIHPAQFTLPIRKWQRNAQELMNKLHCIDGLEVIHSDTTFFLVKLENIKAKELVAYLKNKYNLSIQDAGEFRGLNEYYVRITARGEEQNNLLLEAIKEALTTGIK